MTAPDTADLSATLAEWGERFEEELSSAVAEECDSLERSLSLVAALEGALKRHRPVIRKQGHPAMCEWDNRRWPCPEVAAITAALTREEAGDGKP